jgi:hypothetical protein
VRLKPRHLLRLAASGQFHPSSTARPHPASYRLHSTTPPRLSQLTSTSQPPSSPCQSLRLPSPTTHPCPTRLDSVPFDYPIPPCSIRAFPTFLTNSRAAPTLLDKPPYPTSPPSTSHTHSISEPPNPTIPTASARSPSFRLPRTTRFILSQLNPTALVISCHTSSSLFDKPSRPASYRPHPTCPHTPGLFIPTAQPASRHSHPDSTTHSTLTRFLIDYPIPSSPPLFPPTALSRAITPSSARVRLPRYSRLIPVRLPSPSRPIIEPSLFDYPAHSLTCAAHSDYLPLPHGVVCPTSPFRPITTRVSPTSRPFSDPLYPGRSTTPPGTNHSAPAPFRLSVPELHPTHPTTPDQSAPALPLSTSHSMRLLPRAHSPHPDYPTRNGPGPFTPYRLSAPPPPSRRPDIPCPTHPYRPAASAHSVPFLLPSDYPYLSSTKSYRLVNSPPPCLPQFDYPTCSSSAPLQSDYPSYSRTLRFRPPSFRLTGPSIPPPTSRFDCPSHVCPYRFVPSPSDNPLLPPPSLSTSTIQTSSLPVASFRLPDPSRTSSIRRAGPAPVLSSRFDYPLGEKQHVCLRAVPS